jgi:hypothetical protein
LLLKESLTIMPRPLRSHTLFLLLFLFLSLAACLPAQETITPTPLTTGAAPTIAPQPAEAIPVTIRELVLRPFDYENLYVRVSGIYKPHPPLVCGDAPRRSPASWDLEGEELELQAGGFDTILRAAAPAGLPLTVDGQWRRWRGQSGCGKEAAEIEIWYLDVVEIVSPNPLVYQPDEVSVVVINTVPAIPTELGPPLTPPVEETPGGSLVTPNATVALATPTLAGPASPTAGVPATQPAGSTSQPTPTFALPPTATSGSGGAPTATAAGATATTTTVTPAASGTAGTPTGTTTTTPGATGTAAPPGSTANEGPLDFEILTKAELVANTADLWTFEGSAGEVISITAIAPTDFNLILTLRDPAGNALIANQNSAPADQPETILRFSLPVVGAYELLISEAANQATAYAVSLNSVSSEFTILQPGNLKYGSDIPFTLPAAVDQYWHFVGTAGEVITIRVNIPNPDEESNIFLAVYGPNMEELVSYVDENEFGEGEEILNYQLPVSGYITVYVAENFFHVANYRISLTKQ